MSRPPASRRARAGGVAFGASVRSGSGGAAPDETTARRPGGGASRVLRCDLARPGGFGAFAQLCQSAADDAAKAALLEGVSCRGPGDGGDAANAGGVQQHRALARLMRAVSLPLCAQGSGLVWLELAHVPRFGASATTALCRGIAAAGLKSLSLQHVGLRDDVFVSALGPAIQTSHVCYLSLHNCGLTKKSAPAVVAIVRAHGARRDEATWARNLRRNDQNRYAGSGVAVPRSQGGALTGASRGFPFRTEGAFFAAVPPAVSQLGLLVLDVSANALGDECCEELATCLATDDWLVGVNLERTNATQQGAEALCAALTARFKADEEGALVSLVIEAQAEQRLVSAPVARLQARLQARLLRRDAEASFGKGTHLQHARTTVALWSADVAAPSVELVIADASRDKGGEIESGDCRDVDLLTRWLFDAPELRLSHFARNVVRLRVAVDSHREHSACAAVARRLVAGSAASASVEDGESAAADAPAGTSRSVAMEAWLAATATTAAGVVSPVLLRAALAKALSPGAPPLRLVDALLRSLCVEGCGPDAVSKAVLRVAAFPAAPDFDAISAAADAVDALRLSKKWRVAQLFDHALDSQTDDALPAARFRDALRRWRTQGLLPEAAPDDAGDGGVEALFLSATSKRPAPPQFPAAPTADARAADFAAYVTSLPVKTTARKDVFTDGMFDARALEGALNAALQAARVALPEALGALVLRRLGAALARLGTSAEVWVASLADEGGAVRRAAIADGFLTLYESHALAAGRPRRAAAAADDDADAVLRFADGGDADASTVDALLDACARALDDGAVDECGAPGAGGAALAVAWHGAAALRLQSYLDTMKWTVPALALQIQATARKARRAGTALGRDAFPRRVLDVLLNIDDIRVALEAWGIVSPAPAPLADDDALVEALAALARGLVETGPVKKVSRGERRPSTALTERGEPLRRGARMTVRDVVAFAHAVSEAGGEAFVSVHLVDAALRAARRASAAAEDLERGAVDVESLRENLAEARGVGLDAWLAACATTRPENACLSAADLREGLLGELGGDGDAAAAAAVARAVAALAAFARAPADFDQVGVSELREANAKADAVLDADGPSHQDLVDFVSDGAPHHRVALALADVCDARKWRVVDVVDEAARASGRGPTASSGPSACTPRALCRAMLGWGCYALRTKKDRAVFNRGVGEYLGGRDDGAAAGPRAASKAARPAAAPPAAPPRARRPLAPRNAASADATMRARAAPQRRPSTATVPTVRPKKARAPKARSDTARSSRDDDLLAALETAVVSMASKISHIEAELCTSPPVAPRDASSAEPVRRSSL